MQLWSWVNLRIEDRLQESFGMSKKKKRIFREFESCTVPFLATREIEPYAILIFWW